MNSANQSSGDSHRVFISHSAKDLRVAEALCEFLEANGVGCWIAPRNISPGATWAGSIIEAISRCDVMVLVYSEHSNASQQVLREIERALQRGLGILTYRLDQTMPSGDLEYFLSTVQWLDTRGEREAEFRQLLQSVEQLLGRKVSAVAQPLAAGPATVPIPSTPQKGRMGTARLGAGWRLIGLVGLVMVLGWGAYTFWPRANEMPTDARTAMAGRINVAVLPFRNLSGTAELDWLRNGLSEMFITDLSQLKSMRMLTSQELFDVMAEDGVMPETFGSIEELRRLGRVIDAGRILTGNFALAGDQLEVSIRMQDAQTGEIQLAERSSGSKGDVFQIVDALSSLVQRSYESGEEAPDQDLRNVTTDSLEAYRYYVEGLQLEMALKREEAIVLLKKAVDIDPGFAMAHARLGWIYQNLGQAGESALSLDAAFELSDRLPSRERYLVEGLYYSRHWDSYALAADSWRKALALDPTLNSTRHQLAMLYGKLELFDEAIELWEALRESGYAYAGIENGLAHMYAALGQHARGEKLVQEMLAANPGRPNAHLAMGFAYILGAKPEEALKQFERALELQPAGTPYVYVGMWRANMMARDYAMARNVAEKMLASSNAYSRWSAHVDLAQLAEMHGRSEVALQHYENARTVFDMPNEFTAMAGALAANLLLARGELDRALQTARAAIDESHEEWPGWESRFVMAVAEYQAGNVGRARQLADEIGALATAQPGNILARMQYRLQGKFALADGDFDQATEYLQSAAATLSPFGIYWHLQRRPDHADVWFDLGLAYLGAGNPQEASGWFGKIIASRMERQAYPALETLSYYHLGRAAELLGRRDEARALFGTFLEFAGAGDTSAAELAYARAAVDGE